MEFFILEVAARLAADLLEIHLSSASLFCKKIRQILSCCLEPEANDVFNEEIEIDESYFGGVCKGKRGHDAAGKTIIFVVHKRRGKVCAVVVENTKTSTLMAETTRKIRTESVVFTDYYHSYDAQEVRVFHDYRFDHSDRFADEKNCIHDFENFWDQAKRILRKYNGIDNNHFPLFVKECEFRFNY